MINTIQARGPDVQPADVELIKHFLAFAVDPSRQTVRRLLLSPAGVRLGLGDRLIRQLEISRAHDASAWRLDQRYFRAYTGPFSPLRAVRTHVEGTDWDPPMWQSGEVEVLVGAHPHCVSPPIPPPDRLKYARRVSVQPAEGSTTSCLAWFTVDFFLNKKDEIVAVTYDIWEP